MQPDRCTFGQESHSIQHGLSHCLSMDTLYPDDWGGSLWALLQEQRHHRQDCSGASFETLKGSKLDHNKEENTVEET